MTLLSIWLLMAWLIGVVPSADPPQTELTNSLVHTTLYLPDEQRGYYQGTRFDWSGAFKSLTHNGHSYIDEWFETYDPKTHDAINGPVEEFTALGFADAKPGETFVKIGVGTLRRPDGKAYAFARSYDVADHGKWTVKVHKDYRSRAGVPVPTDRDHGAPAEAVDFTHDLTDATGYGYRYTKTVRLNRNKPELVLEHRLINTGRKVIETSVYNHNFFVIDRQPTGPQMTVRFRFAVKGEGKGFGSIIQARDSSLVYSRELARNEQVFSAGLQGFGSSARDYDVRIENKKTGAGVRITSDQPLEKLVFWACATTSCPEPYIRLRAMPGQTVNWTITYAFYQNTTP